MGKKQDFLKSIVYKNHRQYKHEKLKEIDFLKSDFAPQLSNIYYYLGGQLKVFPVNIGPWDVSTPDFIIELDEQLHFNRYRLNTLNLDLYESYNYFDVDNYKMYCSEFESDCLKAGGYGGKWKNKSTEKLFSSSNEYKNLENNGSSRWKQRAYYDLVKDVTGKIIDVPVIRISIYEQHNNKKLGDLLENSDKSVEDYIIGKINSVLIAQP